MNKSETSHDALLTRESRRLRPLTVWLPLAMLFAYLLGMFLIPRVPWQVPFGHGQCRCLIHSELGLIENLTALLFLISAIMAFRLAWKLRRQAERLYLICYLLFAAAAIVVCLEEINYGQFYFGFETPKTVRNRSTQYRSVVPGAASDIDDADVEMEDLAFNLHNLAGNKPARRLNLVATVGFPVWCILLPLLACKLRPGRCRRGGHWTRYLLPGLQLTLIVILAQSMSWLDDAYEGLLSISQWWSSLDQADRSGLPAVLMPHLDAILDHLQRDDNHWYRATEFKELYWSLTAVLYMLILSRRLLSKHPPNLPPSDQYKCRAREISREPAELSACV